VISSAGAVSASFDVSCFGIAWSWMLLTNSPSCNFSLGPETLLTALD